MTVLVDEARWEWRGSLWAHLVSDESYEELHELATSIGKRRLGFQGDHYDIDSVDRERAIAAGAVAVDSRELVRRLTAAGLRRANAKPRWESLGTSPPGAVPSRPVAGLRTIGGFGAQRLIDAIDHMGTLAVAGQTGAWADRDRLVVLVDIGPEVTAPTAGTLVELADEVVVGGARVDGDRSVELFVTR